MLILVSSISVYLLYDWCTEFNFTGLDGAGTVSYDIVILGMSCVNLSYCFIFTFEI